MKITIDTKEDNHEDIRKVISLLSNLIGSSNADIYSNQSSMQATSPPADTSNMMSMFGDDAPISTSSSMSTPIKADTAPNFGSFLNLVEQKNGTAKKDVPKLEYY